MNLALTSAPAKLALCLSLLGLTQCTFFGLKGSGVIVEETHQVSGFDAIEIHDGFELSVEPGEDYSLLIRTDDNLIDEVRVSEENGRLRIDLNDISTRRATLRAYVTVPFLSSLSAAGDSAISAHHLSIAKDFALNLSGGSAATIVAEGAPSEKIDISTSGGSSLEFSGSATDVRLEVAGGGVTSMVGSSDRLRIGLSGGSSLDAQHFETETAVLELSGGSIATATITEEGEARLSGGSKLTVYGGGAISQETSGDSDVELR